MRHLFVYARVACLGVLVAATAPGQAMIERAVAAAGGSAAGVAGKPVSRGIDKIFGNLKQQAEEAAKAGILKETRKIPVDLTETGGRRPAAVRQAKPVSAEQRRPARRSVVRSEQAKLVVPPAATWEPPPPGPTRDDLAGIHGGDQRQAVVARLGAPSARVFIPDDGHLREVYYFSGGGEYLGTVELSDGLVSVVNVRP